MTLPGCAKTTAEGALVGGAWVITIMTHGQTDIYGCSPILCHLQILHLDWNIH